MAAGGLGVAADDGRCLLHEGVVQWELTRRGLGLCVMMEEVGDHDRRVRRALPSGPPVVSLPTWLVSHRELRTSRRIRVVFDRLAEGLSP